MEYRILGPVDLWRDERSMPVVGQKQRTLLAVLVLNANQVVSHDRLLAALWGSEIPPSGRKLLHNHLWSLRRLLTDASHLSGVPTGYSLHVPPSRSDLDIFTTETRAARTALAAGNAAQAANQLRLALELWRGPALAGTRDELQLVEGAALEEQRMAALNDRIEADLALGRHADLISELRRLIAEHPLQERLRGQLMLALHRSGRTAEALEEYRIGRHHLREEFGLEPGEELAKLHQAILTDSPADGEKADSAASHESAVSLRPSPVPRQLPADIARFTGRQESLEELDALLSDGPGVAPIVISAIGGAGGVGKTALATRWGHRVAHRFPDGQLYVNLHGYSPSEPVTGVQALHRLLRGLGVATDEIPHDGEERAALYRSLIADKRMLIVLDNAASPEQVRPLLPGSALCRVIITSRDSLRGLSVTHDVHTITLDVLAEEESRALLLALIGGKRFGNELKAVDELARLCGYLPLALRLAAAHLVSQPALLVNDFVTKLRQENRLTALDMREDPHIGVRATFELSYRSLDERERRTFRLLGLHPGPDISLEAIAALSGLPLNEVHEVTDTLVRAHLVHRVSDERLTMHDLVRIYARDHSSVDDTEDNCHSALSNMFNWYAHTVRSAMGYIDLDATLLRPTTPVPLGGSKEFSDYDSSLAWLEAERPNLIPLVSHAAVHGWPVVAWQLTHIVAYFFYLRDYVDDWIDTHKIALSAAQRIGDQHGEAMILITMGHAYMSTSQYPEFLDCQRQAVALSRATGDLSGEANALGYMGYGLIRTGRYAEAIEALQQARGMHGSLGNQGGEFSVLLDLAGAYLHIGRIVDSLECLHLCLPYWREQERIHDEAYTLLTLGEAHARLGDHQTAIESLQRMFQLSQKMSNLRLEVQALIGLGRTYRQQGLNAMALDHQQRALTKAREIPGHHLEGEALQGLADVYRAIEENQTALEYYKTALDIAPSAGGPYQQAYTHNGLALALCALGRADEAIYHWKQALQIFTEMGVPEADIVVEQLRHVME
ncbi:BTAD domain-containing putative transcriptional regulator [Streptosporangium sp. NPDC000396]|uniref:AfsR/SARP family transcriptional regulator n=1 Tax=Streptosporangium sp. NPDC000396 TaxID=3366185 RepID=UPI0036847B13